MDTGCLGLLVALGILALGAVCGGVIGLPFGTEGAVAGALVLPVALLAGTLAWGLVSLPWVVLRRLAPQLPELALPRALLGYLTATPATAVALGALVSTSAEADPLSTFGVPVAFAIAAVPLAIGTAVGARYAMVGLIWSAAEVAGSAT